MLPTTSAKWPKLNIATNPQSGFPVLTWERVEGATKYEILRATSANGTFRRMWSVVDPHYTNTTAEAGRTYYYKVQPVGVDVPASDVAYITCDCATPLVTIKTNPVSGLPELSWDKVKGSDKYEVFRATSAKGQYTKMWTVTGTSYTNTTAKAGYTYYYKVKALCTASRYGDGALSKAAYVTCDCAAPVVSFEVEGRSASLFWASVEGAEKYEIYRAANEDGTFMRIATVDETSYDIVNLVPGTTWYKVKALCGRTAYGDSGLSVPVGVSAE